MVEITLLYPRKVLILDNFLSKKRGKKFIIKNIILALSFPILLYVLCCSPAVQYAKEYLDVQFLQHIKDTYPMWYLWLPIAYCLVASLAIALGVPRTWCSFGSAAIFGLWLGILISEIASVCGASITFFYSRWIKQSFLKNSNKFNTTWQEYLEKYAFLSILIFRQLPLPGVIFNIMLGVSRVPWHIFCLASLIGFLPQNLIFSLYGSGIQGNFINIAIASIIVICFSVATYYLCTKVSFVQHLWAKMQNSKEDFTEKK